MYSRWPSHCPPPARQTPEHPHGSASGSAGLDGQNRRDLGKCRQAGSCATPSPRERQFYGDALHNLIYGRGRRAAQETIRRQAVSIVVGVSGFAASGNPPTSPILPSTAEKGADEPCPRLNVGPQRQRSHMSVACFLRNFTRAPSLGDGFQAVTAIARCSARLGEEAQTAALIRAGLKELAQ
jgi:hypothetical protein